jgi:hypothetical protein
MEKALADLLVRLLAIGESHRELYDSEVRERLDNAIYHGFLISGPGYELPGDFALYTDEGNRAVRDALDQFLCSAREAAAVEGLTTFRARVMAFQNLSIRVGPQRKCYNSFFGYRNPN